MNNIGQILQMIQNNKAMLSNPMVQNTMRMYQNHDTEGLQKLAENLCKEKGVNYNEMVNRIRSQFP